MAAKRGRGRPRRVWYRKLRERMSALQVTAEEVGDAVGLDRSTISRKLCGGSPWSLDDAHRVMEYLRIPAEEMYLYFPKNGEDAESKQHHYVQEYLRDTHQSLIATSTLETLRALIDSIETNGTVEGM